LEGRAGQPTLRGMTARFHIRTFVLALLSAFAALGVYAGAARAEFETAFSVTTAGSSTSPQVEVDSAGGMHFLWYRAGAGLQTVTRTAEGSYGPVATLALLANGHDLAVDGSGDVHIVASNDAAGVWTWRSGADGKVGPGIGLAGGSGTSEPRVAAGSTGAVFAWMRAAPGGAVVEARRMALDGTLGPTKAISLPGTTSQANVALDEAGNAVFVWARDFYDGGGAETRRWRADGELDPIKEVAPINGVPVADAQVAFDSTGTALYALQQGYGLKLRRMAPDGTLSAVQDLRMRPSDQASRARIAPSPDGGSQIVWQADSAEDGRVIETRHRFPNGLLGEVQILGSYAPGLPPTPDVAFDDKGNAHHVWVTSKDGKTVVVGRARASSGALGPLHELSWDQSNATGPVLSSGASGRPVATWIRAVDQSTKLVQGALSTPPVLGGDGGSGGTDGTAGTTEPPPDALRPTLSELSMIPGRLRFGRGGRVEYALSEAARVSLRIARRGAGRRVGGRCVVKTRRNRSLKPCDLFVQARLVTSGQPGRNRLTFSGRLRGRNLRPGRYRLVGVATDLAGNPSTPASARFRIVRSR
jgi:hypothetical protein